MKIAIGPLGKYGGVRQHILNIKKHSKYKNSIDVYKPLSSTLVYLESALLLNDIPYVDPLALFVSKVIFSKYDIVHFHGHPYWKDFYRVIKNSRPKYVYTIHQIYFKEDMENDTEWKLKSLENKLMLKVAKNADIVIAVAKWLRDLLDEKYNIDAIHIPNGVNVDICKTANPERFRKKYGIYEDFFLFGGDARWYKRPNLFLELAKRMSDKLFVMKGRGVTKENFLKMGLKIPKNVILLGLLPYEDVIDAIAASRVLILPSKNDTFPTALLEAMACKKVVVAANNAGPREIITHGKDGFLFDPDNPDDLERKAIMAWENPELGKNGYEKVKRKYDWKVVIKQIDRVYEKVLEK